MNKHREGIDMKKWEFDRLADGYANQAKLCVKQGKLDLAQEYRSAERWARTCAQSAPIR